MKANQNVNRLPLGIRLTCWLCKKGIQEQFCIVCPPLWPPTAEEIRAVEEEVKAAEEEQESRNSQME